MYKLILLLLLCGNLYPQVEVKPLYQDYYRQGYWWPINYKISSYSESYIKTILEEFVVDLPIDNPTGYYLLDKNVSQINVFDNTKKIFTMPVRLKALTNDQYLFGVYGQNVTHLLFQDKIIQINLSWLPDCWQGLCTLNALYLQKKLDFQYQEVVQKWVFAGGNIIVNNANFIPLSFKNEMKKNSSDNYKYSYGLGNVFVLPDAVTSQNPDIFQEILPYLQLIDLIPTKDNLVKVKDKLQWNKNTQMQIFALCILHLLATLFIYKRLKKNKVFVIAVITTITMTLMFLWLGQYEQVVYSEEQQEQFFSQQETSFRHNVHTFISLRNQKWQYEFDDLPIPKFLGISLKRNKKNWQVQNEKFYRGTKQVWYTCTAQKYFGYLEIQQQDNNVVLTNKSENSWKNMFFLNNQQEFKVADLKVGDRLVLQKQLNQLFPLQFQEKADIFTWKHQDNANILFAISQTSKHNFANGTTTKIKYLRIK